LCSSSATSSRTLASWPSRPSSARGGPGGGPGAGSPRGLIRV
jgi:hypothetical protein